MQSTAPRGISRIESDKESELLGKNPAGIFLPCRLAPVLVPAFSTIPLLAVTNFSARLLFMKVFR